MTQFVHDSAREVFEQLAPKIVEAPRLAQARRLLTQAEPGERRQAVYDRIMAGAQDPDEIVAVWHLAQEIGNDPAPAASTPSYQEKREASFPAERRMDETVEEWHARLDEADGTVED